MITDWWLGLHPSPSSAVRICSRSNTTETVSLSLGGTTYTAEADIDVDDGNVVFNVTGLTSNSKFPFTLSSTNSHTGTAKTAVSGNESFEFIVGSCWQLTREWDHGLELAKKDYAFFCAEGDQVYIDQPAGGSTTTNPGPLTLRGETLQSISWLSDDLGREPTDAEYMETYYQKYRAFFRAKGYEAVIRSTPHIQTTDDHTWPGNDPACNAGRQYAVGEKVGGLNYLRGTTSAGVTNAAGNFCNSQADADKHWQFGIDAQRAYGKGNPESPDVGSRTEYPYPRLNAEKLYYDFVIGALHVFVLECCAFRDTSMEELIDPYTADRNGKLDTDPTKRMLDMYADDPVEEQWTWLTEGLKNSTSKLKCILSSKETIGSQDAWQMFLTDQSRLLSFLDDAVNGGNPDGWVEPGGCFVISGDVHRGSIQYDEANEHLQIRACPASQYINTNINRLSNARYFDDEGNQGFIAEVHIEKDEYAEIRYKNHVDKLKWHGRIYPGSNALVTDYSPSIAIGGEAL